jgi:putative membrane protein
MHFFIRWLVNIVALIIVARVVPGISVGDWQALIVAAFVLGLLNAFLRPVLIFVTLPIAVLTLGIFTLFINTFLFYLASKLVRGFVIESFWSAFWGALLFSIISFVINMTLKPSRTFSFGFHRHEEPRRAYRDAIDVEVVPDKQKKKEIEGKK